MTDEKQAVPVAQEDREAAMRCGDEAFRNVSVKECGNIDWNALFAGFARHRLASLPCKSGEGAGECTCGCAGDPFICIEADGTDRAAPEGLDTRCGFGAGSPKSPEWLAACEQLALRYDHWKLTDKAAQIRAGHPAWLIEYACVEAIAALSTPSEQFAKSSPDAERSWSDTPEDVREQVMLLAEVELHLQSCRVFLTTREKMHPCGMELHDELHAKVTAAINALGREKSNV